MSKYKYRPLLFIPLIVMLVGCFGKGVNDVVLDEWEFMYEDFWYGARVPGCIHQDLMTIGAIDDPFYGDNEDSVQWVERQEWRYRCVFDHYKGRHDHCAVVFEGLDTYADIYFNDSLLCSVGNMFRPYAVNIPKSLLRRMDNVLEVRFHPTGPRDSAALAALGYDVPDHRVFTRKAPYQQGWDWGPRLNTCGIWRPVHLISWKGEETDGAKVFAEEKDEKIAPYANLFPYKEVTLVQEKDSIGESFCFVVDGEPMFIKGANWIPLHSFPAIVDNSMVARYRYLLRSAKECGFNMLRVWGGGIYEPECFYDLCDSLGIMVWQDFMYSCAFYPGDAAFMNEARQEAIYQVERLSKHPCVVLWCGNNEVKNGWEDWGWQQQYGYTQQQQDQIAADIDRLFGQGGLLDSVVREYGGGRQYISTSPLYGWGHPECVTHGDSHYWGVWWGEMPFEKYAEMTGRFMSEYGFQSYPEWNTILRFCPQNQLYIDSPAMRNHQKHARGVQIIDKAMMEYYGLDSKSLSLEDYCYVSQLLQAWGVGYGVLSHLQRKPYCMGTLYWQLNDCWPVASWSGIDFYGNWKALQYRVRDLFNASDADLQKWKKYYQTIPKNLHLQKAKYTVSRRVEKNVLYVTITADVPLRDVMLQTEPHVDGHFESNFFDMTEGETLTVKYIPYDKSMDMTQVEVSLKTLNDIFLGDM